MMILFTLFIWFDFNEKEFKVLRKNSINKPVFVVCYSPYCPHCRNLPEQTHEFSNMIQNRTDVYVTSINCAESDHCQIFKATHTPFIVLVYGERRKYWPKIRSKNIDDWMKVVDKYTNDNIREIFTEKQLIEAKNEPTDGGTTFYLEVPSKDDDYLRCLTGLSRRYLVYNDTFIYKVVQDLKTPKLFAFQSPECSKEFFFNGKSDSNKLLLRQTIEDFVSAYKFGHLHRYDIDEYKQEAKQRSLFILFVEDNLDKDQMIALRGFPSDYCFFASIGWISLRESLSAMKLVGRTKSDLPLLAYKSQKCLSLYFGNISKVHKSQFIQRALNNEICGMAIHESAPDEIISDKKISGLQFIIGYFSIFLSIIMIIRSKSGSKGNFEDIVLNISENKEE